MTFQVVLPESAALAHPSCCSARLRLRDTCHWKAQQQLLLSQRAPAVVTHRSRSAENW